MRYGSCTTPTTISGTVSVSSSPDNDLDLGCLNLDLEEGIATSTETCTLPSSVSVLCVELGVPGAEGVRVWGLEWVEERVLRVLLHCANGFRVCVGVGVSALGV